MCLSGIGVLITALSLSLDICSHIQEYSYFFTETLLGTLEKVYPRARTHNTLIALFSRLICRPGGYNCTHAFVSIDIKKKGHECTIRLPA